MSYIGQGASGNYAGSKCEADLVGVPCDRDMFRSVPLWWYADAPRHQRMALCRMHYRAARAEKDLEPLKEVVDV